MFALTENDIRIFSAVAIEPRMGVEIASATSLSPAAVSKTIRKLISLGLVSRTSTGIRTSESGHSVALRGGILAATLPTRAMVGGRLHIMLCLMRIAKTRARIELECGLRAPTAYQYLRELREMGIVRQDGDRYALVISRIDLKRLLESLALGHAEATARNMSQSARVVWNDGLQFIIADGNKIPEVQDRLTGTSAMASFGINIRGSEWFYHISKWNSRLGPELVALHTHLCKPESVNAISYCVLLLWHTGFNRNILMEESMCAEAGEIMEKVADVASGEYRTDRLMARREELEGLFEEYGVKSSTHG